MRKLFSILSALALIATLTAFSGSAAAAETLDVNPVSPSLELAPIQLATDGNSYKATWDDSLLGDAQNFAFIIATNPNNEDTWVYNYAYRPWFVGEYDINPLNITASKINVAVVPVDEKNVLLDKPSWSQNIYTSADGFTLEDPSPIPAGFAASRTPELSPFASVRTGVTCVLDGDPACIDINNGATRTYSWPDSNTGRITDLWGWYRGLDVNQPNEFAGAYTRASGHKEATNGNTGYARNPYGLGFCIIESAGAGGTSSKPIRINAEPPYWNNSLGSTTREGVANWIIAHFGQPGLFDVNPDWGITTWDHQEAVGASGSGGPDHTDLTYDHGDDAVVYNNVQYLAVDRMAATHLALRRTLQSVHPGPIVAETTEEADIAALANHIYDLAVVNARAASDGSVQLDVTVITASNIISVQALSNGVPLPGVAVKVDEASVNGIVITPIGTTIPAGTGSSTSQYDSFNFNRQSAGGAFTDASGIANFTYVQNLANASAEFFVDVPTTNADLWRAGTGGGQPTVALGGIVEKAEPVLFQDNNNLTLIKTDQNQNLLPGATFNITVPNNRDYVKFTYLSVLGRDGESDGIDYWTGEVNNQTNNFEISDLVIQFVSSAEFQTNPPTEQKSLAETNPNLFVRNVITRMTGVAPDAVTENLYASQIAAAPSSGVTPDAKDNAIADFISDFFFEPAHITYRGDNAPFEVTVFNGTTDANGEIVLSDLATIYASVYEVSPPAGYELDPNQPRRVGIDLSTQGTVTFTNISEPDSTIKVRKIDGATGDPLANAVFDLYYDTDGNGSYDLLVADDVTSGQDGFIPEFIGDPGTYLLVEVSPPAGYALGGELVITVGDNETADVTFENFKPINILTNASDSELAINSEGVTSATSDQVTVDPLIQGEEVTVEVTLYGPFEDSNLDTNGEPLESFEVDADVEVFVADSDGSNTFEVGNFVLTEAGYYSYVATATIAADGEKPERSVTHEFGLQSETFLVVERELSITTQVTGGNEFELGITGTATVTDTASVTGLDDGEAAVIETKLYGPFDSVDDMVEDEAFLVGTLEDDVVGTSATVDTFISSEFIVTEEGVYTFVERIYIDRDNDDTPEREADHPFGEISETFTVSERDLSITTQVSGKSFELDANGEAFVTDRAFVTGLDATEPAIIETKLYGPYADRDEMNAVGPTDEKLIDTIEDLVVGTSSTVDEYTSSEFVVTEKGVYTFVETIRVFRIVNEEEIVVREATHEFGDEEETFNASEREIFINTQVTGKEFELNSSGQANVADQAFVTGLAESENAIIETKLYGPYADRDEMNAVGPTDEKLIDTVTDAVVGTSAVEDTYVSTAITVNEVGVYTFVERIYIDRNNDGTPEREATHEFGDEEETFTVTDREFGIITRTQALEATVDSVTDNGVTTLFDKVTFGPVGVGTNNEVAGTGLQDGDVVNIEVELYGPFNNIDPATFVCSADKLVGRNSTVVTASGSTVEATLGVSFPEAAVGYYTFVARGTLERTGDDVVVEHACGLVNESVLVTPEMGTLVARKFNSRNPDIAIQGGRYSVWMDMATLPEGTSVAFEQYTKIPEANTTNPSTLGADGEFKFVSQGVTNAQGRLSFDVPIGAVYYMVEEQAPVGYIQDKTARCSFTVDGQCSPFTKEIAESQNTNNPTLLQLPEVPSGGTIPRTGAGTAWILYGSLFALAIAGLSSVVYYRRRTI